MDADWENLPTSALELINENFTTEDHIEDILKNRKKKLRKKAKKNELAKKDSGMEEEKPSDALYEDLPDVPIGKHAFSTSIVNARKKIEKSPKAEDDDLLLDNEFNVNFKSKEKEIDPFEQEIEYQTKNNALEKEAKTLKQTLQNEIDLKNQISTQLDEVTEENIKLREVIAKLKKKDLEKTTSLADENESIHSLLEKKQETINELNFQLKSVQQENEMLKEKEKKVVDKHKQISETTEKQDQEIKQKQKLCEKLKYEVEVTEQLLKAKENSELELKKRLTDMQKQMHQQQNHSLDTNFEAFQSQLESMVKQIKNDQIFSSKLEKVLKKKEEKNEILKELLKKRETQLIGLKCSSEANEKRANLLQQENEQIRATFEKMKERNVSLQKELLSKRKEIIVHNEQISNFVEDFSSIKGQYRDFVSKYQLLILENQKLKQKIKCTKKESELLYQKAYEYKAATKKLKAKLRLEDI